jgi:hypothetical protein
MPTELSSHIVGNLRVELSLPCSQSRRVTVSLAPGRAGRIRTGGLLAPSEAR